MTVNNIVSNWNWSNRPHGHCTQTKVIYPLLLILYSKLIHLFDWDSSKTTPQRSCCISASTATPAFNIKKRRRIKPNWSHTNSNSWFILSKKEEGIYYIVHSNVPPRMFFCQNTPPDCLSLFIHSNDWVQIVLLLNRKQFCNSSHMIVYSFKFWIQQCQECNLHLLKKQ